MIVSYLCAPLAVMYSVHLQLFTNNDLLQVRSESSYNIQICSTLSVKFMAYTISEGLAYIITLYTITSLIIHNTFRKKHWHRISPGKLQRLKSSNSCTSFKSSLDFLNFAHFLRNYSSDLLKIIGCDRSIRLPFNFLFYFTHICNMTLLKKIPYYI